MKRKLLLILISCFFLSGCLYPEKDEPKRIPNEEQVDEVQEAVKRFFQENDGILPIKNKADETDTYIKYLVDFKRLVPHYLAEIPENAYENGGVFQYVIIHPETNPTVKIFDLRIAEQIREINNRLFSQEYPPFKEVIGKNVFTLDYSQLGYKDEPMIKSPYSGVDLPFVITGEGTIYVDYTNDFYQLKENGKLTAKNPGEDIRMLLTEQSIFVPAYSLPYTIDEKGDLVFLDKN